MFKTEALDWIGEIPFEVHWPSLDGFLFMGISVFTQEDMDCITAMNEEQATAWKKQILQWRAAKRLKELSPCWERRNVDKPLRPQIRRWRGR